MKKKHIVFLLVSLIISILLAEILIFYFKAIKPEEFISPNYILFIQSKSTLDLIKKSDKTIFFNPIIYHHAYRIYKTLTDIKIKVYNENKFIIKLINSPSILVSYKNRYPIFIFDHGLKNKLFKFYLTLLKKYKKTSTAFKFYNLYSYKGFHIYHFKILYNKKNFYISLYKNLLLFSISKKAIKESIDAYMSKNNLMENENYLQVKANITQLKTFRFYVNTGMILSDLKKSNYNLFRTLYFLNFIPQTGLSLDIKKDMTVLNGFSTLTNVSRDKYKKLFTENIHEIKTLNLLPETTANFIMFSFKNFKTAWQFSKEILVHNKKIKNDIMSAEKKIEKYFNIPIEKLFFSWLGNKITIATISGYKSSITLLKIKDINKAKIMLKKITGSSYFTEPQSTIYKNHRIYQLKFPLLLEILTKIFDPGLSLPYYAIWKGHFLISQNKEVIKHVINLNHNEELLIYSNKLFHKINKKIKTSNLFIYWNKQLKNIPFLRQENILSQILKNYNAGIFTLKVTEDGISKSFYLQDEKKDKIRLLPDWPLKSNKPILGMPLIKNINASRRDEIIFGDSSGRINVLNIYLKKPYGWPAKINNNLKFPINILYHPEIDRYYIIAVSKKDEIFIINHIGIKIKKITFTNKIALQPIIKDINQDNIPDITLIDDENIIHSYNLNGETIKGFPFYSGSEKVNKLIITNFINTRTNNIILTITSKTNQLKIFSLANSNVITNTIINIPVKKSYFITLCNIHHKKQIMVLSKKGELFFINKQGIIKTFLLKHRFLNPPCVTKINTEHKIILISSTGRLIILNTDGTLYLEKKFYIPPVKNAEILCFDINNDKQDEIFIPFMNNYIYILNKNAEILYKVRGTDVPIIKDIDYNGSYEILTKFKNNRLYFYKLP